MPVFDSSVFVDALVSTARAGRDARAALRDQTVLQVPTIFTAESVSALRGLVRRGELSAPRASTAIARMRSVRTLQYPFEPFVLRVWELRENLTVYDAWYVALAEHLGTMFVTADTRLVGAPGPRCRVEHVSARKAR